MSWLKANQKLRGSDAGVSPVIAVILMVAITVVLAATVYVWVSGFGSQSGQAAKSISLTQKGEGSNVLYTVTGATPGLRWADLKFVTAGMITAHQMVLSDGDVSPHATSIEWTPTTAATVDAGDLIYIMNGATSAISAVELTILDVNANSIMLHHAAGHASAGSATEPTSVSGTRFAGTANDFAAGSTQFTLNAPIDMATLAVTDLTPSAGTLGASTITVRSPTMFDVNWASGSTVVATNTLTIAAGAIDGQTSSPTTAPLVITLTASM